MSDRREKTAYGHNGVRPVEEAEIVSLTEAQMADWVRENKRRVISRGGMNWQEIQKGFFQSVHYLACVPRDEAVKPTAFCWGWRTTLAEQDAAFANGHMPVHLLPDPKTYGLDRLSSNRRSHVRKARQQVKFVQVMSPDILRPAGYDIWVASRRRLGASIDLTREQYLSELVPMTTDRRKLVLAGLIDGRLGGYLEAYAVEGTAYVQHVIIDEEARKTHVGTGLQFEFFELCKRTPAIQRVVHGQHFRENPGLCAFKESIGLVVTRIPARYEMAWPMREFIRLTRPTVYYRLTGEG